MSSAWAWIMCEHAGGESKGETLSHTFVCLLVCVCVRARVKAEFVSLRCSLWPLTLQSDGRGGQALTNEMAEFWPELQTFHNNLLSSSSSSPLLISVIPHPFPPLRVSPPTTRRAGQSSCCKQACFIVRLPLESYRRTPFKLTITTVARFNAPRHCLVRRGEGR